MWIYRTTPYESEGRHTPGKSKAVQRVRQSTTLLTTDGYNSPMIWLYSDCELISFPISGLKGRERYKISRPDVEFASTY